VIVCAAAKPSIDKLFEVDRIVPGAIHRPSGYLQVAGGKGLNAARAAATLGAEVRAVTLLAGHAGRWIAEELEREGIASEIVWTPGESRASLSVADRETEGMTEFYEDGTPVDKDGWRRFVAAVEAASVDAGWLTISGALPPGAPAGGYAQLRCACQIAADTVAERPDHAALVKVNAAEAAILTGLDTSDVDGAVSAARALAEDGAAAVTRGPLGAVLVVGGEAFSGHIDATGPYPVGSGDSFLGGMVTARERGADWHAALALALGAAAANAEIPGAGRFERSEAERLAGRAVINRL
jgi:1-phosphofructokinase family hexose kinase